MRKYEFRDLGRLGWAQAFELQQQLVSRRKAGEIPDQFLIVEHPHVVTVGRNGHEENLLASPEVLSRTGIELHNTDRGGDVTYHGPGQIVGYPILDLRDWKRDVGAYVRALEQMLIDTLADFRIEAHREPGMTGVWTTPPAKIAAIGVHLSRWVTSHGFALNLSTDLDYFSYIVPCGLTKPVTSMRKLGVDAPRDAVVARLREHFERIFPGSDGPAPVLPGVEQKPIPSSVTQSFQAPDTAPSGQHATAEELEPAGQTRHYN